MASIDELVAKIHAVREALGRIRTGLTASLRSSAELSDQFRTLGATGKVGQVETIERGLEEQQARLATATDQAEQVQARAEALQGERQTSGRLSPLASTPDPDWRRRAPIQGFTHRKPVPECLVAIRREGWPRNENGRTSARGFLYTEGGTQVNDHVFRPHRKGQAPPCEDLKEPWRSDEHYTTTWHAERDAAALIREHGLEKAVLYLNVPTCGKESTDPKRCDVNLEKILPAGTELFVWTVHEDGSRSRRRYVGTGEAIDV